ncbi:MAG: sensor histidine kinase [Candidatus Cyclobacteriaceae bacterium M3_2C_046]
MKWNINRGKIKYIFREYILWNLVIALGIMISVYYRKLFTGEIFQHWDVFIYAFLISLLMNIGIYQIIIVTGKYFSWIHAPLKRLLVELVAVLVYSFSVGYIIAFAISYFIRNSFTLDDIPWREMVGATYLPVIVSLGITAFMTSRSFLLEWRKAAIAAEKLRADRYQGQYQSLKDQLNPHFLFNSLNTLTNLVYEDQDQAAKFIQELSRVYRYVLETQKEELVTLEEELAFSESYIALQKLRFGSNLYFEVDVPNKSGLIPPLTLQLLFENAIKHNVISEDYPLTISIKQVEGQLIVRNNLRKKIEQHQQNTGIGLSNINARISYFIPRELEIIEDDFFTVIVPLIKSN